tara:strand:- start:3254 stop:3439 length:186 start_codon:yes stop_codon:yes gene_type:complete
MLANFISARRVFLSSSSGFDANNYPKREIILLDKPIDFSYLPDNEIVLENSLCQEYVKSTY